jgi:hypothetical protein
VIATTSSGRRFAALAQYLLHGRSGEESERVAWSVGRHLGTDDPEQAAMLMQATADQNVHVRAPVYHLTLNFDPTDIVTPEQMQAVADRVLSDLGLPDHQALLVAHQDRAHPHVHIMVNRIHAKTGVAWDRWRDRPKIEQTLRELERELGLREVSGRLYQLDGQEPPERALLTNGERRQAERSGEVPFPERVRAHLAELRAARSWAELEKTLAAHGLHLERKGQGLVITDGERQVKASRVARDLALRQLEARFGVAYRGREASEPSLPDSELSPGVKRVKRAFRERDRVVNLKAERSSAEQDVVIARDRLQDLDAATERVRHASEQLDVALARVYQDPAAARERHARTMAEIGADRATALLRTEPEAFGVLKTVERPRALGLLVSHDETQARSAAPGAAFRARKLADAEQALAATGQEQAQRDGPSAELPGRPRDVSVESLRKHAAEILARAEDRLRRAQETMAHGPNLGMLERAIWDLMRRLEPDELVQLRRVLTTPQAAIAFRAREAAKEILFGHKERER